MKIAYVMNSFDFSDVRKAHGVGHYIVKNIKKLGNDVYLFGGENHFSEYYFKAKQLAYKIKGENYLRHRSPALLKTQTKNIKKEIEKLNPDIILSFGSLPISLIETNIPKFFWTDATFDGIRNYNEFYKNLTKETIDDGNYLEQKALTDSTLCFFASEWARNSAIENYDVDPEKLIVSNLGANLDTGRNESEVENLIQERMEKRLKLLFVGKNWKWKGGQILLNIFREVRNNIKNAELNIVGCSPSINDKNINVFGLIDNRQKEGKEQIDRLFSEASFFVLPTRFESYGHVFCEANSFGVPNLAPDTGGISTIIKSGKNGYLFDYDASPKEYADRIIEIWSEKEKYKALCLSSFHEYKTRLNWEVATKKVLDEINNVLNK